MFRSTRVTLRLSTDSRTFESDVMSFHTIIDIFYTYVVVHSLFFTFCIEKQIGKILYNSR